MTEESRFSRWSRMKTTSRPKGRGIFLTKPPVEEPDEIEPEIAQVDSDATVAHLTASDRHDDAIDPQVETEAEAEDESYPEDLPPIESLNKDSDFTAFMSGRVSDKIRNAALRKLWISNPALANLDGLIDYGEDLTDSFKVVENMQSVYKVGRGMVDYEAEAKLAEEKAQEKEEAAKLAANEQADPNPAGPSDSDESATKSSEIETDEEPALGQDLPDTMPDLAETKVKPTKIG